MQCACKASPNRLAAKTQAAGIANRPISPAPLEVVTTAPAATISVPCGDHGRRSGRYFVDFLEATEDSAQNVVRYLDGRLQRVHIDASLVGIMGQHGPRLIIVNLQ